MAKTDDADKKPADKHEDDKAAPELEAKPKKPEAPAMPQPIIDDLLADPTFDPGGKVRTQLAEISARDGAGQPAPAHLVTADGKPVEPAE